jgi:hypothetical protein
MKKGLWSGSSGRASVQQMRDHKFKFQYHHKKKKQFKYKTDAFTCYVLLGWLVGFGSAEAS